LIVLDENAMQVMEGDFLFICGIKYKIMDLGNNNHFDIYYNLALERWS